MSNSLRVTGYKLQVYKKYRSYSLKRIAYNIIYSEKTKSVKRKAIDKNLKFKYNSIAYNILIFIYLNSHMQYSKNKKLKKQRQNLKFNVEGKSFEF